MKRELSPVTQKSAEQTRDTTPPHKSRKAKGGKDSPITPMNKVKTSPSKSTNWPKSTLGDQPLAWTADGREALMQHLIAEVLKSCDKTQLAEKVRFLRLHVLEDN